MPTWFTASSFEKNVNLPTLWANWAVANAADWGVLCLHAARSAQLSLLSIVRRSLPSVGCVWCSWMG